MNTDDTDPQRIDIQCNHAREVLDAFSSRKEMYLSQVTVEHAETFLNGFDIGCLACGVWLDWQAAAQRRGWNLDSNDWIDHMRKRGLSDG